MAFYLDDELRGSELASFQSHLSQCAACRAAIEDERRFLENIRQSRPLHEAPPELRARVEQLLDKAEPTYTAPSGLRRRVQKAVRRGAPFASRFRYARQVAVLAVLLVVLAALGIWAGINRKDISRPLPPSEFAVMAVDTHLRHLRGQLPLEIASLSPEEISDWFKGKVPFSFRLPAYQESSGQEKLYQLEGARLVGFKNDYAAYVAYQMRQRPISLVVTSATVAHPSGGEEITSKGITFHYDSIDGLKVMTWSDRGLTYALVSDLEERGQQSCMVCHQGTKDRDFIESLKPKTTH